MKQIELSEEAAALVRAAVGADEASELELARVRQSIVRAIATGAGSATSAPRRLWRRPLHLIVATMAILAGGGAYVASTAKHPTMAPPSAPKPVANVVVERLPVSAPAAAKQVVSAPLSEAPRTASMRKQLRPQVVGESGADSLTAELRLMRLAQDALSRDDAEAALEIANEHARRFPSGVLSEERTAVRIMALCSLGRGHTVARVRSRFETDHPASPFIPRIARACD